MSSSTGTTVTFGMSAAAVPAGIVTVMPASASATVTGTWLPAASVSVMLAMSASSSSPRSSLNTTVVSSSLSPTWSMWNTTPVVSPSTATAGSDVRLTTGLSPSFWSSVVSGLLSSSSTKEAFAVSTVIVPSFGSLITPAKFSMTS